jgi:hypothetical protein
MKRVMRDTGTLAKKLGDDALAEALFRAADRCTFWERDRSSDTAANNFVDALETILNRANEALKHAYEPQAEHMAERIMKIAVERFNAFAGKIDARDTSDLAAALRNARSAMLLRPDLVSKSMNNAGDVAKRLHHDALASALWSAGNREVLWENQQDNSAAVQFANVMDIVLDEASKSLTNLRTRVHKRGT